MYVCVHPNLFQGEIATAIIRPEYAFGDEGDDVSKIPPKATLFYDVELIETEPVRLTVCIYFKNHLTDAFNDCRYHFDKDNKYR